MTLVVAAASAYLSYILYEKIRNRDFYQQGGEDPKVGLGGGNADNMPLSHPIAHHCPDQPGKCQYLPGPGKNWLLSDANTSALCNYYANLSGYYMRWVWYNTYIGWSGEIYEPAKPRYVPDYTDLVIKLPEPC